MGQVHYPNLNPNTKLVFVLVLCYGWFYIVAYSFLGNAPEPTALAKCFIPLDIRIAWSQVFHFILLYPMV